MTLPGPLAAFGSACVAAVNRLSIIQLISLLMLIAVLIQIPLILNPGYYSHDELQWASRADVAAFSDLPWESWLAYETYQFRPLTFNTWLVISHFSFDSPHVFHGLVVLWGTLNVLMLASLGRMRHMSNACIMMAAVFFVLSPYALYVHGWVATMADLWVMSLMLGLGLLLHRFTRMTPVILATSVLTILALLSKESAVSIPALLALIWWFDGRQRHWLVACLTASVLVAIYLGLRLPALLSQPADTHYTLGFWQAPVRWVEYHLYWIIPKLEEPHTTLSQGWGKQQLIAAGLVLLLLVAMWQAHRKTAILMVLGGGALLAPVLPLAASAGQYGYGLAAWYVFLVASAWRFFKSWHRIVIVLCCLLSMAHGLGIIGLMREAGQVQAVFSPALAQLVDSQPEDDVIKLTLEDPSTDWLFIRLTHQIHSYAGIAVGDQVVIVDDPAHADYRILANGQIQPVQ